MSISQLMTLMGGLPLTIIAFLTAVSIIVFVHEAGHYFAARLSGIRVLVFSVGFGKPLIMRTDRLGTVWQIAVFPLGGYVRFAEPEDAESNAKKSDDQKCGPIALEDASLLKRAFTVAAGPVANFIFAIAVFAVGVMTTGLIREEVIVDQVIALPGAPFGFESGDRIIELNGNKISDQAEFFRIASEIELESPFIYSVEREGIIRDLSGPHPLLPVIASVRPSSAAADSGIKAGDLILAIDGRLIDRFSQLAAAVQNSKGQELTLLIWRAGETLEIQVAGRFEDVQITDGSFETRLLIGTAAGTFFQPATKTPGLLNAIQIGTTQTAAVLKSTVYGLASMVRGQISSCNVQGPIGIARLTAGAAEQGLSTFVRLIGFLSIAIGFINLLPIPGLDGGHLAFHAFEAVAGRPAPDSVVRVASVIGVMLIVLLLTFGLFNDLTC